MRIEITDKLSTVLFSDITVISPISNNRRDAKWISKTTNVIDTIDFINPTKKLNKQ